MDCVKCPVKKECDARKEMAVQQYIAELRPRVKKVLAHYCPLEEVTSNIISHADEFVHCLRYLEKSGKV